MVHTHTYTKYLRLECFHDGNERDTIVIFKYPRMLYFRPTPLNIMNMNEWMNERTIMVFYLCAFTSGVSGGHTSLFVLSLLWHPLFVIKAYIFIFHSVISLLFHFIFILLTPPSVREDVSRKSWLLFESCTLSDLRLDLRLDSDLRFWTHEQSFFLNALVHQH